MSSPISSYIKAADDHNFNQFIYCKPFEKNKIASYMFTKKVGNKYFSSSVYILEICDGSIKMYNCNNENKIRIWSYATIETFIDSLNKCKHWVNN